MRLRESTVRWAKQHLSGRRRLQPPSFDELMLQRRLTVPAPMEARNALRPIPWKPGTAPEGIVPDVAEDAPLPAADFLHWAYTTAEAEALADVFTPGIHYTEWNRYTHNWASYENQFTGRSPARDEKCLFYWAFSQVGPHKGIVLKNNCHLATDSAALPLRSVWGQIITETGARLIVDSGTAGGVGSQVQVGDAIIATSLHFDCQKTFGKEPFAQALYPCTAQPQSSLDEALELMAANAHLLSPQTTRPLKIWTGHNLTTDFFAEDTSDDKYGLRAFDPNAYSVEMDASVLGLVAEDLGEAMPPYVSIRSASDPQMPAGASEEEASDIYLKFGYGAQVAAETVCQQQIVAAL